ncbi:hypothetical protein SLE2022_020730 [Rubroshorea leprosula]
MNRADIVDLSSDDDLGEVDVKPVIVEPSIIGGIVRQKHHQKAQAPKLDRPRAQESEENRSPIAFSAGNSSNSVLEQGHSPVDDTVVSSVATLSPATVCRQFWKAGKYDGVLGSKVTLQNSKNHLQVHPMFLHSNATSHKWAFGVSVAELLDNAIDEIQNGITFALVDKISNPKDGSPALLIQDDGGGMDPDAMRLCMSFGFSNRKSKSAIGQYGNGFKDSSMRLGADVIVFSHHLNNRSLTQSIGLLSYTFLTRTGHDRIVVHLVDYEFNTSKEAELLKEFDDIGSHGTKIIIYNLWFNNDGKLELDFDSDSKDIRIQGDTKKVGRAVNELHIANQYNYSLRVIFPAMRLYLSILYLRVPETFRIVLHGEVVEHHNVVDDLMHRIYIVEASICWKHGGYSINIHGFCVYHKNRLILPFWQVVSYSDNRGRGVVGALEANLSNQLIINKILREHPSFKSLNILSGYAGNSGMQQPILFNQHSKALDRMKAGSTSGKAHHSVPNSHVRAAQGLHTKRKEQGNLADFEKVKWKGMPANTFSNHLEDEEANTLMQENKKLHAKCLEYKKRGEELDAKVTQLRNEIGEVESEYDRLLKELESLDVVEEKNVHM